MSIAGVASARTLVASTLEIVESLKPGDWSADTASHGWRVHDLVTHLGFFFNFIADPNLELPDNPSGKTERLNDAAVRERADWTPTEVVDYYREQSKLGLVTLSALQEDEYRDKPIEMFDLGTYTLAQLSDAVTFDHLVHLTCDLLAPHGPIASRTQVDVDATIGPALDWMIAGLPQMCGAALDRAMTAPVGLRLTGHGERTLVLDRDSDGRIVVTETPDLPTDIATSSSVDFLRWGTTRSSWRSAVTITGDPHRVAPILDAIDVI